MESKWALTDEEAKQIEAESRSILGMGNSEKLTGGEGDNRPDSDFPADQLAEGIRIESEHTDDHATAKEIAKDHLVEDPLAYTPDTKETKGNAINNSTSKDS